MAKKTTKQVKQAKRKEKKLRALDRYDIKGYFRDIEYLGKLSFLREGTREWMETRMYELRDSANMYEHKMGELLIEKKIDFIHQAPFAFRPRTIYFCDFFLPKDRIVIEVDGIYHKSQTQLEKDRERDANFKSIGIRVIRVTNEETMNKKLVSLRLAEFIPGIV